MEEICKYNGLKLDTTHTPLPFLHNCTQYGWHWGTWIDHESYSTVMSCHHLGIWHECSQIALTGSCPTLRECTIKHQFFNTTGTTVCVLCCISMHTRTHVCARACRWQFHAIPVIKKGCQCQETYIYPSKRFRKKSPLHISWGRKHISQASSINIMWFVEKTR